MASGLIRGLEVSEIATVSFEGLREYAKAEHELIMHAIGVVEALANRCRDTAETYPPADGSDGVMEANDG